MCCFRNALRKLLKAFKVFSDQYEPSLKNFIGISSWRSLKAVIWLQTNKKRLHCLKMQRSSGLLTVNAEYERSFVIFLYFYILIYLLFFLNKSFFVLRYPRNVVAVAIAKR